MLFCKLVDPSKYSRVMFEIVSITMMQIRRSTLYVVADYCDFLLFSWFQDENQCKFGENDDFYSIFLNVDTLLLFSDFCAYAASLLSIFSTFFGWSHQNIEYAKKIIRKIKSFMSKLPIVSFTKSCKYIFWLSECFVSFMRLH